MSADRELPDPAVLMTLGDTGMVRKLIATSLPLSSRHELYAADQLRAYGAEREALGRRKGLEEAAEVCDQWNATAGERLAAAIRQLAKE